jgi:hypothetical protein
MKGATKRFRVESNKGGITTETDMVVTSTRWFDISVKLASRSLER